MTEKRQSIDTNKMNQILELSYNYISAELLQSCPTLCDPVLPGSSVHRSLQPRIRSGLPLPSTKDLPSPGMKPAFLTSPALAGRVSITSATWVSP